MVEMIGSSELMDALKGIGLNLYERKLWVALLAKGTATAGELSGIANVPRSRTYDVLQTLANKGFVIVQTSKPLRYVAISPEEALEKAREKVREKYLGLESKINKLKKSNLIKELNSVYKDGLTLISPGDLTGALKGKFSLLQHTDSMFKNASSSVNIVTTPSGLNELFENHVGILKKLSEKGVKVRIAAKIDETCSDAIKAFLGIAEIRNISQEKLPLSGRFYTIDGQQFVMGLSNSDEVHSSQDMIFWTKSEHAAKNTIEPLFNLVWENSKPVNLKKIA